MQHSCASTVPSQNSHHTRTLILSYLYPHHYVSSGIHAIGPNWCVGLSSIAALAHLLTLSRHFLQTTTLWNQERTNTLIPWMLTLMKKDARNSECHCSVYYTMSQFCHLSRTPQTPWHAWGCMCAYIINAYSLRHFVCSAEDLTCMKKEASGLVVIMFSQILISSISKIKISRDNAHHIDTYNPYIPLHLSFLVDIINIKLQYHNPSH